MTQASVSSESSEGLDPAAIAVDLFEKRHELSAELDRAQTVITRIKTEIAAVDTVLHLFGQGSPFRMTALPHYRRNTSQIVLSALRESPRPLTAIELAKIVLTENRMSPQDHALVQAVAIRIRATLAHYRKRGAIVAIESAERSLVWALADVPVKTVPGPQSRCK